MLSPTNHPIWNFSLSILEINAKAKLFEYDFKNQKAISLKTIMCAKRTE